MVIEGTGASANDSAQRRSRVIRVVVLCIAAILLFAGATVIALVGWMAYDTNAASEQVRDFHRAVKVGTQYRTVLDLAASHKRITFTCRDTAKPTYPPCSTVMVSAATSFHYFSFELNDKGAITHVGAIEYAD